MADQEEWKGKKDMDPRRKDELAKALALVDSTVDKQYVARIEELPVFEPAFLVEGITAPFRQAPDGAGKKVREIGSNVELFELERFVFEEDEKILDKLISVYQAAASYENAKLCMLIRSSGTEQRIYLGVAYEDMSEATLLSGQAETLKKNFVGNFPGSRLREFRDIPPTSPDEDGVSAQQQKRELLREVFCKGKSVAAISGIPAIKSENREENRQFTQGLEKFMDSILGEKVDVLILAEPVLAGELKNIKNGYQELYSNLSPFCKSVINVTKSNGESVTETVMKGVTDTTNESVAKTHTHTLTQGTSSSHSVGGHAGVSLDLGLFKKIPILKKFAPKVNASGDYHYTHGKHRDTSDSDGETITTGVSKSLNEQNSTANSLSSSYSDGLQLEYENRSVKTILERIECQLERIRDCEDYGIYDCGVYVISDDPASVLSASASFRSIMRGKESSAEASYINSWQWKDEAEVICNILAYLSTMNHPVFRLRKDSEETELLLPVSPSTIISGRELSIQMGMPRRSVSGISVLKTARFGRKVLYVDEAMKPDREVILGNIYHMNDREAADVALNVDSLRSHVFITGSTGSGKSTTVYKLLHETLRAAEGCTFMVIEPAKGEYRSVFGGRDDVAVYGTNLNEVDKLLKLDPFCFPHERIHVLEHIDRLIGIFNACWPMYAAMPAILKDSIERAYLDAGWDLTRSVCEYEDKLGIVIYPGFSDVLCQIEAVLQESRFSADSKGDYTGALVTRLKSLTNGINGLIFTADELDGSELFDRNVIVDLSRVASNETRSLIMGMLLIKQQEYRIAGRKGINERLKHITVLEEAHNILKRTSTEQVSEGANLIGRSVEMMSSAIAEMRTYGECFVIVDQSPGAVDASAIRNTNTKIIMRLPDVNDREQVGRSAGLNDEQIAELARLKTGVAAVYQNDWVEPILCEIRRDVREKAYELPEGYLPDWSGDEQIVKEVIDVLLAPFFEDIGQGYDIEHVYRVPTKYMVRRVLSSGLDAVTKVRFYEFCNTEDDEEDEETERRRKKELSETIIHRMLCHDDVWRRALAYRKNIREWYRQMTAHIRPDITDLERESVNRILEILAYKQGQLFEEQKMPDRAKEASDILEDLMKNTGRGGADA